MKQLLLAVTLMAFGSQVFAEKQISAGAGANLWAKTSNEDELEAGSEPGVLMYVAAGQLMEQGYRAELELSYRRNNVHGINDPANGLVSSGDGNVITGLGAFINLSYDLTSTRFFKPYVMSGVGLLHLTVEEDNGAETPLDDSAMTYGLQVGAGVRFKLRDHLRGNIGFRHMFTGATELDGLKTEFDTSTITFSLVRDF